MRWSIFDPNNASTLNEVRQKFGVSSDRLNELQKALRVAKAKIRSARSSRSKETHPRMLRAMEVIESMVLGCEPQQNRRTLLPAVDIPKNFQTFTRKEILEVFNKKVVRSKLQRLMHQGDSFVFVCDVGVRGGVKKVYKLDTDHTGRIEISLVIPENPKVVPGAGLFSATIVDKLSQSTGKHQKKSHSSAQQAETANNSQKKPRVRIQGQVCDIS